jgi:hypothetical protein
MDDHATSITNLNSTLSIAVASTITWNDIDLLTRVRDPMSELNPHVTTDSTDDHEVQRTQDSITALIPHERRHSACIGETLRGAVHHRQSAPCGGGFDPFSLDRSSSTTRLCFTAVPLMDRIQLPLAYEFDLHQLT